MPGMIYSNDYKIMLPKSNPAYLGNLYTIAVSLLPNIRIKASSYGKDANIFIRED